MKIHVDIPTSTIETCVQGKVDNVRRLIRKKLSEIGLECVTIARNLGEEYRGLSADELDRTRHRPHQPNYIDYTGNLRHSLSYVVLENGIEIDANYGENREPSEQVLNEVKGKYGVGYALILIAGMEYAATLTFEKGYDVLSSPNIKAKEMVTEFFEQLARRLHK